MTRGTLRAACLDPRGHGPEEDEEELDIRGDFAEDAGLEDAGDDAGSSAACGEGLVASGVLMLLAFRVVMVQIAMRRG